MTLMPNDEKWISILAKYINSEWGKFTDSEIDFLKQEASSNERRAQFSQSMLDRVQFEQSWITSRGFSGDVGRD